MSDLRDGFREHREYKRRQARKRAMVQVDCHGCQEKHPMVQPYPSLVPGEKCYRCGWVAPQSTVPKSERGRSAD
jgi:hypothetical protein